jgi:hypothetical protein
MTLLASANNYIELTNKSANLKSRSTSILRDTATVNKLITLMRKSQSEENEGFTILTTWLIFPQHHLELVLALLTQKKRHPLLRLYD